MSRIAAIDYGTVRIGLAVSDEKKFIATPIGFIPAGRTIQDSAKRIIEALSAHGTIEALVIGLPLHFSGKDSPMCGQVRQLAALLKDALTYPIILWDERLSSAQVERTLREAEMNRKKRTKIIDAMAAAAILQNYLDSL